MGKLLKRALSLTLALLMVLSMVPAGALGNYVRATRSDIFATVNGTGYSTLADAITAAEEGDTVKILKDLTDSNVTINKKLTIDLGGHTVNEAYWFIEKAEVKIRNGSIKNTTQSYPLTAKFAGAKLIIDNVNIEDSKSQYVIYLWENTALEFNSGSILHTKGENNSNSNIYAIRGDKNTEIVINGGTITVNGGTAKAYGIYASYDNANVTVNGGKISTSSDGSGYNYAINTNGNITVNGGEIETGANGKGNYNYALYSAKGNVTVAGGTITTNGNFSHMINVSGSAPQVNITGGTFVSENATTRPYLIAGSSSSVVTATVEAGTFTGFSEKVLHTGYSSSNTSTAEVTGGTFDIVLQDKFIANGAVVTMEGKTYTKNENGSMVEVSYAAQIGGTFYETLDAALQAAKDGETIILLADATPALTSQRAITKAAVIDLNGKTLTLAEDDLYFGTTTFQNGTIVVDPSVKASTAVFWMFENQTLTFNNVDIVATGVSGTYLIGINGGTGTSVALIDSTITIENAALVSLSTIICDNGTGNSVVVDNCEINVDKVNGRFYMGGNSGTITVKDSDIDLNGVKEGFYLRDGQTMSVEGDSVVDIVLNDTNGRYGINFNGEVTYTKADTATVNGTDNKPVPVYAAKIDGVGYTTFADALAAAKTMTGDVVVELYDKVTLNTALSGSYDSIAFVGQDADAEIYLDVQGYITATGKKVAFEDLVLSKAEGGYMGNAGFMNVAFGVYDVVEVAYTNCTFANGSYASSGEVTYTGCTFKKSWDKYGLWAYGDADITVDNCVFDDYRGIKMYAEGAAKVTNLTVKDTDFSAVNNKPAIVLTYGQSVILEGNTYSDTGVFELDLDGAPNGTAVTSTDKITCKNDNGACGVLVDGKIYTTVAQAAEVAAEGSTVTLLHNSTEIVELAEGVILNKNGYTAAGVTVTVSFAAEVNGVGYKVLGEAIAAAKDGDTITLLADINAGANEYIELNGKKNITFTAAEGVVINGNISVGYHPSHIDNGIDRSDSTFTVDGLVVNGTLTVASNDANLVIKNCKAAQITVRTYNKVGMNITIDGNTADGAMGTATMKYGMYVLPNATDYNLTVSNNTFKNIQSHAFVVQGNGDGAAVTAAHSITVTGNNFESWGLNGGSNRAAFKIWADTKYAPAASDLNGTTNAMRELVDAIAAAGNTYASTAENTVQFDAYGAAGDAEDFPDPATYVASINGVKYQNLQAAINAANSETVVLLMDVATEETIKVSAGAAVILDLNGKTITGKPATAAAFAVIENKGVMTITDSVGGGKILCKHELAGSTSYAVNAITHRGTLTINNGIIENTSTASNQVGYGIDNFSALVVNGGKVTASGSNYYDGIRMFCNSETVAVSLTVNGGEISSIWMQNASDGTVDKNTKDVKGSLTITGGTVGGVWLEPSAAFEAAITGGKINKVAYFQTAEGRDLTGFISGGTFNNPVAEELCVKGYVCVENEDGTYGVVEKTLTGSGTVEAPYVIYTAEDLFFFAEKVNDGTYKNVYAVLGADIDLEQAAWTAIGTESVPFQGHFDGRNYTISNLVASGENCVGLFGKMTNYGSIKNVKLKNVSVQGVQYVAGIVGWGYTGAIENCHVFGSINIAGNYMVGGINGAGYARITNCSVIGNDPAADKIVATHDGNKNEGDNVGGIVGHNGENNNLVNNTVKNVTVSGTRKVGGIVGTANMGTKIEGCSVNNVIIETTATVDYANDNLKSMSMGGIVGHYQNSGSNGTIVNCEVSGLTFVNTNNVTVSAGALVGGTRGSTEILAPTANIDVSGTKVSQVTGATNTYLFVAKVGENCYVTLVEALKALTAENNTLTLLTDVSITEKWDNRYTGAKINAPVIIDGNGKTITFTGEVSDGGNYFAAFRFEANATVKDLTIDMSEVPTAKIRAISAKADLIIDGCTFIGNGSTNNNRAVIFGEGAGAAIGDVDVSITNSQFTNWRRGVTDNENGQDAKTVTLTGNTFTNASVALSAIESVVFTGNTVTDGNTVSITSYTGLTNVTATGNTMTANAKTFVSNAVSYDNIQSEFQIVAAASVTSGDTVKYYNTLAEAIAAAGNGDTITLLADAKLDGTTNLNKTITIDGNGFKIGQSANFVSNGANAMFDIMNGATVTFENVVFDGIQNVAIMRTVSANVVVNNCVVSTCKQTVAQGLFRLACGNATITNTKFLNNECTMVVSFGYDAATDNDVLLIDNCLFEGNSCKETAVVYFASGDYGKVTNTQFINNKVTSAGNAATLYMGWGSGYEVSGCTFDGNTVTTPHATTKRFASAIFADGCTINGNVFGNNTAIRNGETISTTVAVGAYYGAADIGENYWGGNAPVPGVDYTVEYTRNDVAVDDYYADEETTELVTINYVAKVGKYSYTSLQAAIDAAAEGETVVLLSNIDVDKLVIDKNVIIDLNDNTINGGDTNKNTIEIQANVTIKNGTVTGFAKSSNAVIRVSSGKLVLDDVVLTNTGSSYINRAIHVNNGGAAELTDCTVTGRVYGLGTLEVKSGTYYVASEGNGISGAGIAVSGGIFHYPLTIGQVVEGYKPKDNGDDTWTVTETTFATDLIITDIFELQMFRDMVNAGNNFAGKTVKLGANIDMNNATWTPIGKGNNVFSGTFDGQGYTISNLSIGNGNEMGLFGKVNGATIKNLTINNAKVLTQGASIGVVVGSGIGLKLENVKVTGLVQVTGNNYVGGIVGYAYGKYTNCSVDAADGSYVQGNAPGYTCYVGGLSGWIGEGDSQIVGCSVNNITVRALSNGDNHSYGVGGLAGLAHHGTVIKDCTVTNVVIEAGETTMTGSVVGANIGTAAAPTWIINNTVSNVTATVNGEAAEIGISGMANSGDTEATIIGTGAELNADRKLIAGYFEKLDANQIAEGYAAYNLNGGWLVAAADKYVAYIVVDGEKVYYESVQHAIDEAAEGQTVYLFTNATVNNLNLYKGVTLDLNGYTLTVNRQATAYGEIKGEGLLVATRNTTKLKGQTTALPVWNGTGYYFTAAPEMQNAMMYKGEFVCLPIFSDDVKALFANGTADDAGLYIVVTLTYELSGKTFVMEYVVTESTTMDVYSSNQAIYITIEEEFQNLTYTAKVVSDTSAEFVGATVPHGA